MQYLDVIQPRILGSRPAPTALAGTSCPSTVPRRIRHARRQLLAPVPVGLPLREPSARSALIGERSVGVGHGQGFVWHEGESVQSEHEKLSSGPLASLSDSMTRPNRAAIHILRRHNSTAQLVPLRRADVLSSPQTGTTSGPRRQSSLLALQEGPIRRGTHHTNTMSPKQDTAGRIDRTRRVVLRGVSLPG